MSQNPAAPPSIEKVQHGELACWRVVTPSGEALIAEQGAQVLQYQGAGGQPVIWLSEQAKYARGAAVRGGAPVCWPWFGDLARNPQAVRDCIGLREGPQHGWVRTLPWDLSDSRNEGDSAILIFTLDTGRTGLPWPHHAVLTLTVEVGAALTLSLATHNLGTEPLHLSQALHAYFAVSDARTIALSGFDGKNYIDTLDGWREKRQSGDIAITGETDRIYLGLDGVLAIDDPGWNRRIVIEPRHSSSAVVWNPWIGKAAQLSQFAPDAWQRMICIETARVWDDPLVVAPGQSADSGMRISCACR
jgi:glucose-6-phosphate 1-epimerase